MAEKDFILQGLTPRTHTEAIQHLFELPDIDFAILSVAFVTDDGVRLIENALLGVANRAIVFSGIRNEITSKQGLVRLFNTGVRLYVVDTGARGVVFHPKLYLTKNSSRARVIVGSANLTLGGLNNNIEASITLDLDLTNQDDKTFLNSILGQFSRLPEQNPENILPVTNLEELDVMQISGRLLDELEALPPRPPKKLGRTSDDNVPRIQLHVEKLHRTIRRRSVPRLALQHVIVEPSNISPNLELVWQSQALTRRDLDIPTGETTNRTGSINLDKGLLDADIDHRHYFRNEVFHKLTWTPTSRSTVEESHAQFQLVVKDISYGTYNLRIGHTIDTDSKAYQQRNAMTRLSWGDMQPHIAREDLIGRTMSLYRDEQEPSKFLIEVD